MNHPKIRQRGNDFLEPWQRVDFPRSADPAGGAAGELRVAEFPGRAFFNRRRPPSFHPRTGGAGTTGPRVRGPRSARRMAWRHRDLPLRSPANARHLLEALHRLKRGEGITLTPAQLAARVTTRTIRPATCSLIVAYSPT